MVESATPNSALHDFLERFFADGAELASLRYHVGIQAIKIPLVAFLRGGPIAIPPPLPDEIELRTIFHSEKNDRGFLLDIAAKHPWDSSKMAAEFIAILCTDLSNIEARVSAAAFNSRSLGGLPTLTQLRLEPSANLVAALSRAIAVQQGGNASRAIHGGRTLPASATCLVVSLTDCAVLKAREQHNQSVVHYKSYGHDFALLVDTSGVGLYQAWGGNSLSGASTPAAASSTSGAAAGSESSPSQQTTTGGHATLAECLARWPTPMTWDEALGFACKFEAFCKRLAWDDVTNDLYEQLFGVNMTTLAAVTGLPPPGRIKSWVRILEVQDVTAARVGDNARFFL